MLRKLSTTLGVIPRWQSDCAGNLTPGGETNTNASVADRIRETLLHHIRTADFSKHQRMLRAVANSSYSLRIEFLYEPLILWVRAASD